MPVSVPTVPAATNRAQVIDALLTASRAMVAIASRSLADVDAEVTLAQSRALVVLAARGPQRIVDIATDLGVAPSTATRMCDRLVRKGLIRRSRTTGDRREVRVALTRAGQTFVGQVSQHRRDQLERLVTALPDDALPHIAVALDALNAATGELPDREWWLAPETQ